MRVGSLFSGYGGLDMAVERYFGATTAWHVEFDKHPSTVLAQRWPGVPNYGDVTAVDWSAVEPVDILTGGFPCQDVSYAGLRKGVRPGTRSGLWEHFAYAIQTLRPRLVVIENVSGLLSADAHCDVEPCPWCVGDEPDGHMRALGAVLSDLAEIGFDAEWASVRASDAGAPHRRERVFIVARDAESSNAGYRRTTTPPGPTGGPDNGTVESCAGKGERRGVGTAADATRERHDGAGDAGPRRWTEPADRSADPDGLTLLPTPAARDHKGRMLNSRQGGDSLPDAALNLLPTPSATDGSGAMKPEDRAQSGAGYRPALRDVPYLLPTPAVNDMGRGKTVEDWDAWTAAMQQRHGNGNGHGKSLEIEAQRLLPTPSTGTSPNGHGRRGGRPGNGRQSGASLDALAPLLSTPTAGLGTGGGQRSHRWGEGSNRTHNPTELAHDIANGTLTGFGPYTAAIRRWEQVLGRPAPSPTEPGKDGRPRLSPRFVEFMMGLPDGWVTGVGIPRSAQLKALGNGVVPQQAALALSMLLPRLGAEVAA